MVRLPIVGDGGVERLCPTRFRFEMLAHADGPGRSRDCSLERPAREASDPEDLPTTRVQQSPVHEVVNPATGFEAGVQLDQRLRPENFVSQAFFFNSQKRG